MKDGLTTFMLALIIVLLGAVGTLTLVINYQTKELVTTTNALTLSKLDTMAAIFLKERERIELKVDKVCKDVLELERRFLIEHGHKNNSKG